MAKRSKKWFIKKRGSYLPHSLPGALTYIPYIAYLVLSVVVLYHQTNSWTYTAFGTVPQWVAATVILTWVAARTS